MLKKMLVQLVKQASACCSIWDMCNTLQIGHLIFGSLPLVHVDVLVDALSLIHVPEVLGLSSKMPVDSSSSSLSVGDTLCLFKSPLAVLLEDDVK